jgi:hypothetical protein
MEAWEIMLRAAGVEELVELVDILAMAVKAVKANPGAKTV